MNTVAELIEVLKSLDPDSVVKLAIAVEGGQLVEGAKIVGISINSEKKFIIIHVSYSGEKQIIREE